MKCYQSPPGFELVSLCPFPMTVTITPQAPPLLGIQSAYSKLRRQSVFSEGEPSCLHGDRSRYFSVQSTFSFFFRCVCGGDASDVRDWYSIYPFGCRREMYSGRNNLRYWTEFSWFQTTRAEETNTMYFYSFNEGWSNVRCRVTFRISSC